MKKKSLWQCPGFCLDQPNKTGKTAGNTGLGSGGWKLLCWPCGLLLPVKYPEGGLQGPETFIPPGEIASYKWNCFSCLNHLKTTLCLEDFWFLFSSITGSRAGWVEQVKVIQIGVKIPSSANMLSVWLRICDLMSLSLCFFIYKFEINDNTFSQTIMSIKQDHGCKAPN